MALTVADFKAHADAIGRVATQPSANAADPATKNDTKAHRHHWYPVSWELRPGTTECDYNRPILMACSGRNSKGRCTAMPRADQVGAAFDPVDRIFIQQSNGQLKFIAGNGESTLVVNAGAVDDKSKKYALIPAKVFLGAAKVLTGKGDIDLSIDGQGVVLRTSQGGKIAMPNMATDLPGYVRAEPALGTVELPAGFWPSASKVVEAVVDKYWPFDHVSVSAGEGLTLSAASPTRMAEGFVDGSFEPILGGINANVVKALRNMKGESVLSWGEYTLTVTSGAYTLTTLVRAHHPGFPHRDIFDAPRTVVVRETAKALADSVSLAGAGMIDVVVKGDTLVLGDAEFPVEHEGEGKTRVDGDLLKKLVKAWPSKNVVMSFGPDSLITLEGDVPWTMRLAPVVM